MFYLDKRIYRIADVKSNKKYIYRQKFPEFLLHSWFITSTENIYYSKKLILAIMDKKEGKKRKNIHIYFAMN